jgi:outer membrane lipoprotein carrier protein
MSRSVALRCSLLLGFAVLASVPVAAATAPPDPDAPGLSSRERLDALFDRVRTEQTSMRSLEARFTQRKESEMLIEPEVAQGQFFYLAPDRVRWEFLSPNPMTVVIDDQRMTTWYRDLKRADVLSVGRYSEQVLQYLGASGTLETLLDYFRVQATFPTDPKEPYRLRLDPRYPRIAKRIETMDVWIDRKRFVPVALRYVEPDGDVTEYRFSDIQVNANIPPERFELDLPADVKQHQVVADRSSE